MLGRRASDRLGQAVERWLPRGGSARDATWLMAGQIMGLLATVIATPIQLDRMGGERYGLVVIISATVTYLHVVDLGAGFAVMRAVPWHRARNAESYVRSLTSSGILLNLGAGMLAGTAVWLSAGWLTDLLRLEEDTRAVAVEALHVTAFLLPALMLASVLSSIGRVLGMFRLAGLLSGLFAVALNVAWAVVAGREDDVKLVAATQVALMGVVVLVWVAAIARVEPAYLHPLRPSRRAARELLGFGSKAAGGLASLNVVMQADKLMLASLLPVAILPTYSIPFALTSRITFLSSALVNALFPRISAVSSAGDIDEMRRLQVKAARTVGIASGALAVMCAFAGEAFLEMWVNADFANDARGPLLVLAAGFAALAAGSIGSLFLVAVGRAGLNALMTLACSATGLGLGAVGAATLDTTLAAAAGISTGLVLLGAASTEASRRLVLHTRAATAYTAVLVPWAGQAAAGALGFLVAMMVGAPPAGTIVLVGLATAFASWWAWRRGPSRETPAGSPVGEQGVS